MDELLNFLVNNRFDSSGNKVNKTYSNSLKNSKTVIDEKSKEMRGYELGTIEVGEESSQLVMGDDIRFDLSVGITSHFKQQLYINRNNSLHALSDLQYKLIATLNTML